MVLSAKSAQLYAAPRLLLSASLVTLYMAGGLAYIWRYATDPLLHHPDFYKAILSLADVSSRTLMLPLTFAWALFQAPSLHLAQQRLNRAGLIISQMGLIEGKKSSERRWVSWPLAVELVRLAVRQPSSGLEVHFRLFHAVSLICMSLTAGLLDRFLGLASTRMALLTSSLVAPDMDRLLAAIRAMDYIERSTVAFNKAYSLHLLLLTVIPYLVGISFAFDLLDLLFDGDFSWPPVQGFIMALASAVFCCSIIWNICSSCASISVNAKKFTIALYQLMMDDSGNRFINNAKLRLHIAQKRNIVFTACGFFNLDLALILSILASAATYLVILVQFGQPQQITRTIYNTNNSTQHG